MSESSMPAEVDFDKAIEISDNFLPDFSKADNEESAFNMKAIFLRTFKQIMNDYKGRLTNTRKAIYLAGLAATGRVGLAAKMADVTSEGIRLWRGDVDKPPVDCNLFNELEEQMDALHDDLLVAEAIRRGAQGTKKGVWYQGEKVGEEREYSDNLLMFAIKARLPQYKDNSTNVNINAGDEGSVNVNFQMPEVDGEIREVDEKAIDVTPEEC